MNPYKKCPTLIGDLVTFRLVKEADAKDLTKCYGDKKSVQIFNNDNCPTDFYYPTEEEVLKLIKFWLWEYSEGGYVRFAIEDQQMKEVIGTIEIFAKKEIYDNYGKIGTLRVDLASAYEDKSYLQDIFQVVENHFRAYFEIDYVITKVRSVAVERLNLLKNRGYRNIDQEDITSYNDYYIGPLK